MSKPELEKFSSKPEWFENAAKAGLTNLLAFADDQVILGWMENDKLTTTAIIDTSTLQSAHLFGKDGELRILRTDSGMEEIWLEDNNWAKDDIEDENYLLWNDGEQGLNYVRPVQFSKLIVRHYIRYDDQGQAYFSHSRLVSFS